MRAWRGAAALLALTVAGCATTSTVADPVQPGPATSGTSQSASDPAQIVGSWHVDADGEPSSTILTIGDRVDGGLLLFHPCGMLSGSWRANRHGMFIAALDGGDSACFPDTKHAQVQTRAQASPTPTWLVAAVSFSATGGNVRLLAADGRVVATLRPGAQPKVGPNDSPDYVKKPVVTSQMRADWREPAPLPDGVQPATAAQLQRKWLPMGSPHTAAFVQFGADGWYEGSDGCNGQGGRYLVGPGGVVLATSGPSTLIGCETYPLASWVTRSGRLGLRQHRLVFVSPTGKVLGEAIAA